METSDWIYIGGSLFLGFSAIFGHYISEWVRQRTSRPKFKILFEHKPPFSHQTKWRALPNSLRPIDEPVYYFHFHIKNEGKTQARQCEVVLERLWIYDDYTNLPKKYQNLFPVNLNWTKDEFVGINPGRTIPCAIGYISSREYQKKFEKRKFIDIPDYNGNDLRFMLPLRHFFYSQPNCLPPGEYILQFTVYSENVEPEKIFLNISWSGKWQDKDNEMFKEIVIKRIEEP